VDKGQIHQRIDGPTNYVKAVSIDPLSRHIAMLSCDRTLRIVSSSDKRLDDFIKKQNVNHLIPFQTENETEAKDFPKLLLPESEIEKFFHQLISATLLVSRWQLASNTHWPNYSDRVCR
jgi:hypothetical protein